MSLLSARLGMRMKTGLVAMLPRLMDRSAALTRRLSKSWLLYRKRRAAPMAEARPSIDLLACGCFFKGRTFYPAPKCDEHDEEEDDEEEDDDWSCDNCGETAMDGSDRCNTFGCEIEETACCYACGERFQLDALYCKPPITRKIRPTPHRESQE